jgi:hypothetical protein
MLSPDQDFAEKGSIIGINYLASFRTYKRMLSDSDESTDPIYRRIFGIYNASLFGTAPPPKNDFIDDAGVYDAELEEFRRGLCREHTTEGDTDAETGQVPRSPSPQVPSTPPELHVSISMSSTISHAAATTSQVSNIIIVGNTSPSPTEIEEISQASKPKKSPREKKGAKPAKTIAGPSDCDAGDPPATKKVSRRPKPTPVNRPTSPRKLRNRA